MRAKTGKEIAFARRVVRHVKWRLDRATTIVADRMRRGDRVVIMTPPAGMRFGNWLYLWLDAHARSATSVPTRVLEAPGMDVWLREFPALASLTIARDDLRFHDRREWDDESWNQRFGIDFTRQSLDAFISDCLAPEVDRDDSRRLVINVRRGDYYSDPGLRERYGFDQLAYLREALAVVGPVGRALVVSDDPDWCRENLLEMVEATSDVVDFAQRDPVQNFKAVAGASRIIGTNSTFSYWSAYVAGVVHASPVVVMPRFHGRLPQGSDAYQLDPGWSVIEGHF